MTAERIDAQLQDYISTLPLIEKVEFGRLSREEQLARISLARNLIDEYENGRVPGTSQPSRTERIAAAIVSTPGHLVDSIKELTLEKVGRYAWNYITSQSPHHLFTEDWVYRGAAVTGIGLRALILATGVGAIPVVGGSAKMGISIGGSLLFYHLGEIDKKNYFKKIENSGLSEEEKQQKIAEFNQFKKHQVGRVRRGLSWGLGLGGLSADAIWEHGGSEAVSNALHQAQMVLEGAQQTDWAEVANNIGKSVGQAKDGYINNVNNNIAVESGISSEPSQTIITFSAAQPHQVITPIEARVPGEPLPMPSATATVESTSLVHVVVPSQPELTYDDLKLEPISFNNAVLDAQGRDLVSIKGLAEAMYRDALTQKAGLGAFDPHNVQHLEFVNKEIAADTDYTKKVAAYANLYVNYINKEFAGAFSINDSTGVYGETAVRMTKAGQIVQFHNIDDSTRQTFFSDNGQWHKYYAPEGEKIVTEASKKAQWNHFTFPEDPIYKDLKPEDLQAAHFAKTDINPAHLHHTGGLANAVVSQQVEGHPGVDFSIDGPEKEAALADAQANPLHDLEVQAVQTQFDYDNTKAVVESDSGNTTDFFYSADAANNPTPLNLLVDYSDLSHSLAPLVDEQSLKDGVVSPDFWQSHVLDDYVYNPGAVFESIADNNTFSVRTLAEAILAKEYGMDIETIRQQIAQDPVLASKLEKAIAYIKVNNALLLNEDKLSYKSPITGHLYSFKLPKGEALKKILALF